MKKLVAEIGIASLLEDSASLATIDQLRAAIQRKVSRVGIDCDFRLHEFESFPLRVSCQVNSHAFYRDFNKPKIKQIIDETFDKFLGMIKASNQV